MIEKRYFNYNEIRHIVKNCSKSKMIKINEIVKKMKFDENSKKNNLYQNRNKKIITILFMNLNLFDSNFTIMKCILKNKYEIKIIIDNNLDDYEFINFVIAYEICEIFECVFVKLMKYRVTKKYDEKTNSFIIHVIYFRMKINFHIESFTTLIITSLINHLMILKRF